MATGTMQSLENIYYPDYYSRRTDSRQSSTMVFIEASAFRYFYRVLGITAKTTVSHVMGDCCLVSVNQGILS